MSVNYGWIITRDVIGDEPRAVNLVGPSAISPTILARLHAGEGQEFRMFDDDGDLYYEGRCIHDESADGMFGPLDDYGTPNAGATEIRYKNDAGVFQPI